MLTYIIVDDEYLTRKGILKKIEKSELPIVCIGEAENGEDALELIDKHHPQIIITDMNMPIIDGPELLKEVTQNYPSIKIIVISGYTDFNYMQRAISSGAITYLLKPFSSDELKDALIKTYDKINEENALENTIKSYEQLQIDALLQQDVHKLSSYLSKSQDISPQLSFVSPHINSLLGQSFLLATLFFYNSEAIILFKTYIQTLGIKELIVIEIDISDNQLCLLYFFEKNEDQIRKSLIHLISSFYKESVTKLLVGISNPENTINKLSSAYDETIQRMNLCPIVSTSLLTIISESQLEKQNEIHWDDIERLLFFIESGNIDEVKKLLNSFFNKITATTEYSISDLKKYFLNITAELRSILDHYFEVNTENKLPTASTLILNTLFETNEIFDYFQNTLTNITLLLSDSNKYSNQDTIDKVKLYIENHYNRDLSLDQVSSFFYMNPSYLSTIFKEKTGVNYIDFINMVRIEKAKILLKKKKHKIYQVAKAVGYDNPKYFFKLFKKITGMTPNNYRKSNE